MQKSSVKLISYICIIIMLSLILTHPKPSYAICPDAFAKLIKILGRALVGHPDELDSLGRRFKDAMSSCDGQGIVITPDPNQPTPTTDPLAPTFGPPPPGSDAFVFFCQADTRFQSFVVPDIIFEGCGPTSMSMSVCTKSGQTSSNCNQLPQSFASALQSKKCETTFGSPVSPSACYGFSGTSFMGEVVNGKSTGIPAVVSLLKQAGRHVEIVSADIAVWDQKIKEGNVLITYSPDTPCEEWCAAPLTRKLAHIFVVDAVNVSNGSVHLRDPINCLRSNYAEKNGGRWLTPLDHETSYTKGPSNFSITTAFAVK